MPLMRALNLLPPSGYTASHLRTAIGLPPAIDLLLSSTAHMLGGAKQQLLTQHPDNLLAPQAQLRPGAFEACVTSTWTNQSASLRAQTDACLNVVSWKQELFRFPCR